LNQGFGFRFDVEIPRRFNSAFQHIPQAMIGPMMEYPRPQVAQVYGLPWRFRRLGSFGSVGNGM